MFSNARFGFRSRAFLLTEISQIAMRKKANTKLETEHEENDINSNLKRQNQDRKETHRHQSLSNGCDVIDDCTNIERVYEIAELNKALKTLTEKQRKVFLAQVLDGRTFREIGDEPGIHKQTVLEIYNAAIRN